MKALTELSRRELAAIRPYEPGKPIEEVQAEYGLDSIVKLASNENPLGPSPQAVTAIGEALSQLHLYPDGSSAQLKVALANQFGVTPEWLTIGNGSDEIIKRLGETFLTADDEIIIADPTFSEYKFAADLMGATTIKVPCHNHRLDLEGFKQAITPRTKLIFICNPNNPTGTIVTAQEVTAFLAQIPEHLLVVFDEAYAEYVTSSEYQSGTAYLQQYPNVVVLRTFSKIYGLAALRIGYGLAHPQIIQLLEKAREPFNVNRLAQISAYAALADQEHLERSCSLNATGKKQLLAGFREFGWSPVDTETNFILVNTFQDGRRLFQDLLKQGVIIRPCDIFGLPTYIRVTIGTEEENTTFLTATANLLTTKQSRLIKE